MKILVTGVAGFIGFHTVRKLFERCDSIEVVGIDNINDYYPMTLKFARLNELGIKSELIGQGKKINSEEIQGFSFVRLDIVDKAKLTSLFENESFDYVIHLAAQAGVRYSIENPDAYIQSNITGFNFILEMCRNYSVQHLVYASSSSVYGLNKDQPFSVSHRTDEPISVYAASKKANELLAHTYSHLFGISTTGLRFFTVYGPWGRPDMAPMLFANAIVSGKPIKVFNNGNMERDFTYVGDIVEGIVRVMRSIPEKNVKGIPYRIFNIGNSRPINLLDFIKELEKAFGIEAIKNFLPMQDGDVFSTYADVADLQKCIEYRPETKLPEGIKQFADWFKKYNNLG